MKVKVLYFAALRERMGVSETVVDAEPAETAARLAARLTGMRDSLAYAINDELVKPEDILRDGDTLALIPPMAGG